MEVYYLVEKIFGWFYNMGARKDSQGVWMEGEIIFYGGLVFVLYGLKFDEVQKIYGLVGFSFYYQEGGSFDICML